MQEENPILNRVAQSGLITVDLDELVPKPAIVPFDLAQFLEEGFLLREKPFREALSGLRPDYPSSARVALYCSTDAILPRWAWMLAASTLQQAGYETIMSSPENAYERIYIENLHRVLDPEAYREKRVTVKGCGSGKVPESAYVEIVKLLQPVVRSLMYGEPCSTVPVFKPGKNPAR